MGRPTKKAWQLRLSDKEDAAADQLATKHGTSKNDVVRRGLRLLALMDELVQDGHRVLVERPGGNEKREAVEVWLI